MKYLVDANVLSEPTKPVYNPQVVQWLIAHEADLLVSPLVLGEIWRGVDALPKSKKKQALATWFETLCNRMTTLDWTTETALEWAEMVNRIKKSGYTVGILDTMIAATAKVHQLTVAARNVADFQRCVVPVVNPFL